MGYRRDSAMSSTLTQPAAAAAEPGDAAQAGPRGRRMPVSGCPLCLGRRVHYAFSKDTYRVVRCADCRFMFLSPQPSDDELAAIYGGRYFIHSDTDEGTRRAAQMKSA